MAPFWREALPKFTGRIFNERYELEQDVKEPEDTVAIYDHVRSLDEIRDSYNMATGMRYDGWRMEQHKAAGKGLVTVAQGVISADAVERGGSGYSAQQRLEPSDGSAWDLPPLGPVYWETVNEPLPLDFEHQSYFSMNDRGRVTGPHDYSGPESVRPWGLPAWVQVGAEIRQKGLHSQTAMITNVYPEYLLLDRPTALGQGFKLDYFIMHFEPVPTAPLYIYPETGSLWCKRDRQDYFVTVDPEPVALDVERSIIVRHTGKEIHMTLRGFFERYELVPKDWPDWVGAGALAQPSCEFIKVENHIIRTDGAVKIDRVDYDGKTVSLFGWSASFSLDQFMKLFKAVDF